MTASEQGLRDLSIALGDRYLAERELGRGGMGTVYLARDLQLDRNVAIKVLPSEFAADAMLRERFVRETRIAASFSHPNIVPVHAVEDRNGVLAFVMGYVEGESVAQRVARAGPLAPRECVRLLQDIAYALAYAHGRGVVHRDIKPDTIMLERATGRALLMDFGVSRSSFGSRPVQAMTRVGESVGTPEFMSPEQAAGEELDGRSDLYSLGLTAYFALLGRPAIAGDSAQRLLVRQLTEVLPPLATLRADLPAALASAVDRCLAKDRNERFPDAAALVDALERANAAAPDVPVPIRLFAQEAATLGLLITFILIFVWMLGFSISRGTDSNDALLPMIILIAVVSARVAQTFSEARRLFSQGFSVHDVRRGFQAGIDERDERRRQLKADPATRAERRRIVRVAVALLVAAPTFFWFALKFRVTIRPGYHVTSLPGVLLLVAGLLCLGFAFPLLLRSPFRMSASERAFRAFWLGIPGRLFLSAAARRTPQRVMGLSAVPLVAAKPRRSVDTERLASLEARIAQLEKTVTRAG